MKFVLSLLVLMGSLQVSLRARADAIQFLPHGDGALAALYQTVLHARRSVDMAYFIFEPCDASTKLIMRLLAARAQRGIHVRVLLDAFMLTQADKYNIASFFKQYGVELRFYNNTFVLNPNINLRSHIKFTVADGETYVTGGRNIGDDYFSLDADENFVDRDVLVSGASGRMAQASFEELWRSHKSSRPGVVGREPLADFTRGCFALDKKALAVQSFLRGASAGRLEDFPVRRCENVSFVTDDPLFADQGLSEQNEPYMNDLRLRKKRTTKSFLDFVNGTRHSLEVENWSYIPSERVSTAFDELRRRQVRVQVITNGAAGAGGGLDPAFDHLLEYFADRDTRGSEAVLQISHKGRLSDRFALTPVTANWKLHGKVAVRDHVDVMVGSYNIDPRSYGINLESAVIARNCPALAQDLEKQFADLKQVYQSDARNCAQCRGEDRAGLLTRVFSWMGYPFF